MLNQKVKVRPLRHRIACLIVHRRTNPQTLPMLLIKTQITNATDGSRHDAASLKWSSQPIADVGTVVVIIEVVTANHSRNPLFNDND